MKRFLVSMLQIKELHGTCINIFVRLHDPQYAANEKESNCHAHMSCTALTLSK